jgi:hypothetical protein
MKSVPIYSLGAPGAFSTSPSDPNYWTDRINYEFTMMMYLMNQEGIAIQQAESTDFTSFLSDIDTWVPLWKGWLDGAFTAAEAGTEYLVPMPAIPSLIPILVEILAGGANLLVPVLIHLALQLLGLGGGGFAGNPTVIHDVSIDLDGIETLLEELNLLIEAGILLDGDSVFTSEDSGSTMKSIAESFREAIFGQDADTSDVSALIRGLLDTNTDGDKFAVLWALARQAIHILAVKEGIVDEAIIQDYPE